LSRQRALAGGPQSHSCTAADLLETFEGDSESQQALFATLSKEMLQQQREQREEDDAARAEWRQRMQTLTAPMTGLYDGLHQEIQESQAKFLAHLNQTKERFKAPNWRLTQFEQRVQQTKRNIQALHAEFNRHSGQLGRHVQHHVEHDHHPSTHDHHTIELDCPISRHGIEYRLQALEANQTRLQQDMMQLRGCAAQLESRLCEAEEYMADELPSTSGQQRAQGSQPCQQTMQRFTSESRRF
jgi:hypothetical protein